MMQKLRLCFPRFVILTSILALTFGSLPDCAAQPKAFEWNATSKMEIILPQDAALPEQTAANELKDYLTRITGGDFAIASEGGKPATVAIYVGDTKFAASAGVAKSTFGDEEWLIQTHDSALILAGGGSRGTLYATYHFLEDVCGVHWWNPWEETVPTQKVLSITNLNQREKPTFNYRDIYMTYGHDDGRFAVRNRLDRDGDAPIGAEYGGGNTYGPPYFVHTFFFILSPEKYYKDHPDWFIGNGAAIPVATNAQLAMSNPEMRKEFLKLLLENIRNARQAAKDKGLPPPDVFSVSQEDNFVKFETPADAELLKENGGAESAILLSFVNYLADGIKDEFPSVYIDTLAYYSGEKAPTNIRPRDNVIIRLTNTTSNKILPITDPRNQVFHDNVVAWGNIAKNLRIWDYSVNYAYPGLPKPTEYTYPIDLRFFEAHHVTGVFVEHEFPILADMRDFKLWVQCKLFENPNQDYDALVREFTDGFYGAAGPFVREYITALHNEAESVGKAKGYDDVTWTSGPKVFNYLSVDFAIRAEAMFDEAELAAGTDKVLMRRVRHARMSLDRYVARVHDGLTAQWVSEGHTAESMPLKLDVVTARYLQSWNEQIDMRLPEADREAERKVAIAEVAKLTAAPAYSKRAASGDYAKFNDAMLANAIIFGPDKLRNPAAQAVLASDKEAETGHVMRFEIPDAELEKYKLPMPWGIYDTVGAKEPLNNAIQAADIPTAGYHWYKMGELALPKKTYLYFFWSWIIQVNLTTPDTGPPNQIYEVWAQVKFEGPAFPYGKADVKNAISVERVALVKK